MALDIATIRRQFPWTAVHAPLAYLDSAATTQQPLAAIDAVRTASMNGVGSVHRGLHPLSDASTHAFEQARATCATFLGAEHADEVVFTSGTTMGINLVAHALGERWGENDAVAVTTLDHHSNILPWMALRERRGVDVRWIGCTPHGQLQQHDIEEVFRDGRIRLLAITGQSNVLGTRPDLAALTTIAHHHGAYVCIDAAQRAAHAPINVQALDCDFLACSGHKLYGPTGIGLLYGKRPLLSELPPFLTGGGMVQSVTDDLFIPSEAPARFEAGSPNLLGAIGLAMSLEWQTLWNWNDRIDYERHLLSLLLHELRAVEGVRILGPADDTVHGCVSFVVEGIHAHDIADILGSNGICVRAGHHCAEPLHRSLGIDASVRASVGIYTTEEEIRTLAPAIRTAQKMLLR